MSKTKKFFKGLGVISVPALCVYAIVGAVVVPLLIFETGASKESNPRAEERTIKHWNRDFADPRLTVDNKNTDKLENHFKWNESKPGTFKVDGRISTIYELTDGSGKVINAGSERLMIFTHGLNSTHWNAMETAYYWSKMGYRVISWDQRGGGENRDSHITFGYSEADDLSSLYQTVTDNIAPKKQFDGVKYITIYGQSNGAATTLSFADRYSKQIEDSKISTKFIEESGYTSPKRQFETALNLHGIMPAAVVPLTIPMYELYADKNLSDENADYLAQSDQIPKDSLFIAHGDADPIVDYQMGIELYKKMDANNQDPSIYIGKGLGHIGVSRDSDINVTGTLLDEVSALFNGLSKITDKASAEKALQTFDSSWKAKVTAGYPDAVRFFYHVYMWDKFGIRTVEGGGHVK